LADTPSALPHPAFIYGTAWKKDATAALVLMAAGAGFRAIDTANQPKHYQEPLVGEALNALAAAELPRQSLFLQTKFTPIGGHDHRVPYDPQADLAAQVRQSFESSLVHLRTTFIDSYLLHGPYSFPGLGRADWLVWEAIEEIHRSGRTGMIGISNVNAGQLLELIERARIAPMVVQNRCFANRGWDQDVRRICGEHGIMYQGFSLLTANLNVLRRPEIAALARRLGVSPEQVVFRFAIDIGMVPLTGTTSEQHMREDLRIQQISLTDDDVALIESIAL
jgi:diketogulonate reductase-like aldo/keto reductase